MGLQAALRLIYPPQCVNCGERVDSDFGLCGPCWRETGFIAGLVCETCGLPLPGEGEGEGAQCDDCLMLGRPWERGRAAFLYRDVGRKLVLGLKHADRTDLARPAGEWLHRAARPILQAGMLVAPVPLHWRRLFRRRYNQAALVSARLAHLAGLAHCPDLLQRVRPTGSQEGRDRAARFGNLAGAMRVHKRRVALAKGAHVLLVDDVMTSGATLTACAEACLAAGATRVSVAVLARVAKDA
ncbi:ComF family protein [Paragemmobacter straminiformis]|uniref:ComF family protein n=1 Tax=Paragemmobacter straminiformis TaxID=2045119 RepID=A0A842IAE2_9RHOB|nr:ComF family protein [Gemmobacter straminiformis]MBC2836074.1 ComF family protein [Gemmobacter straminiformis]